MAHRFSEITFTRSVEATQKKFGSYERSAQVRQRMPEFACFDAREKAFIEARDSFYMATVSETGWPYMQHRGGDVGFLQVLDSQTLVFINYTGNGQYQSLGNLANNPKVALFLIDYPNRRRMKILGLAQVLTDQQMSTDLRQRVQFAEQGARFDSVILIKLEAFDWNCSQHITPRFTASEMDAHAAINQ